MDFCPIQLSLKLPAKMSANTRSNPPGLSHVPLQSNPPLPRVAASHTWWPPTSWNTRTSRAADAWSFWGAQGLHCCITNSSGEGLKCGTLGGRGGRAELPGCQGKLRTFCLFFFFNGFPSLTCLTCAQWDFSQERNLNIRV